ncbi:universal stress protein [Thermodesulfobacteriota bacterium]
MEKHLLVTVSEQMSALYGVRFVGNFFVKKEKLKITLFYTTPRPSAIWEGERTVEGLAEWESQAKNYEAKGKKALESAKKELQKMGFKSDSIITKLQIRQHSKVMDIIQEGEKGLYDALVLGRRGLTWLEEAFEDSVSKELFEKKVNFPIWICRKLDPARKNLLACVDGSDASNRMVDHVGFIMSQETEQEVTLLTIRKKGGKVSDDSENILSKSRAHLTHNGFPEEMVSNKILENNQPAEAILKEAKEGHFGAVALGRTGAGRGFLQKVFMGSVSDKLFRELEGASLWICY